jgi:hypothetical protein
LCPRLKNLYLCYKLCLKAEIFFLRQASLPQHSYFPARWAIAAIAMDILLTLLLAEQAAETVPAAAPLFLAAVAAQALAVAAQALAVAVVVVQVHAAMMMGQVNHFHTMVKHIRL